MTRLSRYLLPTEKQAPADAEAISHKLMVRAGLIRQVGSGMWSWLPAGWRVHRRIEQIIRQEMDAIGAQEMLMPVLQPAELWRKTGRIAIEELFKLTDRKGSELVLAMTHEEVVTSHVAQLVRSYRDLPLVLYHFQVKERDEPRPRAGVLRTREFIMKDSYSFDRDEEGLAHSYELHICAYDRMMERCGLRFYRVASDVGMMGGRSAHEYMAPCPAGENEVALAGSYAANVEVASAQAKPANLPEPLDAPVREHTPGLTTVEEVSSFLGVPASALLKAYPVAVEVQQNVGENDLGGALAGASAGGGQRSAGMRLVLVLVRGDHFVNETKLERALHSRCRPASAEEIESQIGPAGFIGPVGLQGRVQILLDEAVHDGCYVTGGNERDVHLRGVRPGRDFTFDRADVRTVCEGDLVNGIPISIERAIEVGNIFQLGLRYTEPFGARFLDEEGHSRPIWMGCYGIGPARVAAAAVEQYADERGISWPKAISPFDVHIVAIGREGGPERRAADALHEALRSAGFVVICDDRDIGPGQKLADADLLGAPLRLTVGRRALEAGEVEVLMRRGGRRAGGIAIGAGETELADAVRTLWATLP